MMKMQRNVRILQNQMRRFKLPQNCGKIKIKK
jgi:hypothetical protein